MTHDEESSRQRAFESCLADLRPTSSAALAHQTFYRAGYAAGIASLQQPATGETKIRGTRYRAAAVVLAMVSIGSGGYWLGQHEQAAQYRLTQMKPEGQDRLSVAAPIASTAVNRSPNQPIAQATNQAPPDTAITSANRDPAPLVPIGNWIMSQLPQGADRKHAPLAFSQLPLESFPSVSLSDSARPLRQDVNRTMRPDPLAPSPTKRHIPPDPVLDGLFENNTWISRMLSP